MMLSVCGESQLSRKNICVDLFCKDFSVPTLVQHSKKQRRSRWLGNNRSTSNFLLCICMMHFQSPNKHLIKCKCGDYIQIKALISYTSKKHLIWSHFSSSRLNWRESVGPTGRIWSGLCCEPGNWEEITVKLGGDIWQRFVFRWEGGGEISVCRSL